MLKLQWCTALVIDENATDEATRLELEIGRDKEQSRAITRQIGSSQATILQPVSGNGAGRKAKGKTETRHGGKERPSSITALKMIAKQETDEKPQLEDWKAELMGAHGEAVEAQYQEMEKQRKYFTTEIEALQEESKGLKENKAESKQ